MFKTHNIIIAVTIFFTALLLGGTITGLLAVISYFSGVQAGKEEDAAVRFGDNIRAKAVKFYNQMFN